MLASFVLFSHDAGYRAFLAADLLDATLKRLQMYVLRSKVTLASLGESHVAIGVAGTQAGETLRAAGLPVPEAEMACAQFPAGNVIRLDSQRFVLAVELAAAPALFDALSGTARAAGPNAWQWLDIRAGIVLITAATKEEFVPQMVSFDKIGGVSFHKGCYPGQEVVARARYLGKVKRHLYRISIDTEVAAGTPIFQAGDREMPCGRVANVAPVPGGAYVALAVVKESVVDTDEIRLEIPGVNITGVEPTE